MTCKLSTTDKEISFFLNSSYLDFLWKTFIHNQLLKAQQQVLVV